MIEKRTVYLPVKVEDDTTFLITKEISNYLQGNSSIDFYKDGKCIYTPSFITQTSKESEELEHLIIERLDKKEVFVFTQEQLNNYTEKVIKESLEIASENSLVFQKCNNYHSGKMLWEDKSDEVYITVRNDNSYDEHHCISTDKESITSQFDEIFKKFKV